MRYRALESTLNLAGSPPGDKRSVETRAAMSAKSLKGRTFRSSMIFHIVFLPSPGRSSSMWNRVDTGCASL